MNFKIKISCFEYRLFGSWYMEGSPVRGLRPVVAARLATLNVPQTTRRTSLPLCKAPVMDSKILSTAFAASALERPELPATEATRSFLFTGQPPLLMVCYKTATATSMQQATFVCKCKSSDGVFLSSITIGYTI